MESKTDTYRSVPTTIRAKRWTGDNLEELREFATKMQGSDTDDIISEQDYDGTISVYNFIHGSWVGLLLGQWLIYGGDGDFYPCAHSKFVEKYQPWGEEEMWP